MILKIKRSVLCGAIWKNNIHLKSDFLCNFVLKQLNIKDICEENKIKLKDEIRKKNLKRFYSYWKQSNNDICIFKMKYACWLQKTEVFVLTMNIKKPVSKKGRPKKNYLEVTDRTKRRRKIQLRKSYNQNEICAAILPGFVKEQDKSLIRNNALALYMDMGFTKYKYQVLREFNKKNDVSNDKFPEYGEIKKAKRDCYPANIDITEESVFVNVQDIVDHTVFRLVLSLGSNEVMKMNSKEVTGKYKWGMDGASSQQQFKQNFRNLTSTDKSVFSVSFVPLEISLRDEVIWTNERSSSPRLCRPMSFEFTKETINQSLQTFRFYKNEIDNLKPTILENVRGIYSNWQRYYFIF